MLCEPSKGGMVADSGVITGSSFLMYVIWQLPFYISHFTTYSNIFFKVIAINLIYLITVSGSRLSSFSGSPRVLVRIISRFVIYDPQIATRIIQWL